MQSSCSTKYYSVAIDAYNPTCECKHWKKTELPCKHIFAVLENSYVQWSDLPETFTNHPLFTMDSAILTVIDENFCVPNGLSGVAADITQDIDDIQEIPLSTEEFQELNGQIPEGGESVEEIQHVPVELNIDAICVSIRATCKIISDSTYCSDDVAACKQCLDGVSDILTAFQQTMAGNPDGIPYLKKKDRRFKTLKGTIPVTSRNRKHTPMRPPRSKKRKRYERSNTIASTLAVAEILSSVEEETLQQAEILKIDAKLKNDLVELAEENSDEVYIPKEMETALFEKMDSETIETGRGCRMKKFSAKTEHTGW